MERRPTSRSPSGVLRKLGVAFPGAAAPLAPEDSATDAREPLAFRQNLAPSLAVFLVSLPLAMGIAIASGVPPARGLVTAVVGGLVIGVLTGSRLVISGPSAGLAVMVLDLVSRHGIVALSVVVPLMGLLQAGAGLSRLGQVFRAVAPAVIHGMLAGIGVLIFAAQFHVMVDDTPKGSGLDNLLSIPEAFYRGFAVVDGSRHFYAACIGVLTLLVLVGMRQLRRGPLKAVPAPLVAVGVSTAAMWAFELPIRKVEMPASFLAELAPPSLADLSLLANPSLVGAALALAFVASAETLLCATAVDALHTGRRTNYDRELFAQGVGNTVCGLLGAPPASGVITRSSANVQAGATSPASAIMVGAWLLLVMLLFPALLKIIPRASLAGLLVYIGYKLVSTRPLQQLRWYGKSELFIFSATLSIIVLVNLLSGIVVGLGLAAAKLVYSRGESFHRLQIDVVHEPEAHRTHLHLRGAASFLRLPRLAGALERMPSNEEVHLHVEELEYIDHACLELLEKWESARMRSRAPVRVQWNKLRHRYHTGNRIDRPPAAHARPPNEAARLLDFLGAEAILINPSFNDKWHAIQVLSRHLISLHPDLDDPEHVIDSATQREHEGTTCMGQGLMVPHARLDKAASLSGVMAVSSEGWDFGASDGIPVRCVVLLATPERDASRHLAILAAFARLFMLNPVLKDQLLMAHTPEEALSVLQSTDAGAINYAFDAEPLTPPPAAKSA